MAETSASLLQRVCDRSDQDAWRRLEAIYSPLIRGWLRRDAMLDSNNADDIVQDVMAVLVRRIEEFERQRSGSFRAWLKSITLNCLRQSLRKQKHSGRGGGDNGVTDLLNNLEDPNSALSDLWNREHDEHVMKQILQTLQSEFTETTWKAFELMALEGRSAQETADLLSISSNAVFIAKSRVMGRLRAEADGLIDD